MSSTITSITEKHPEAVATSAVEIASMPRVSIDDLLESKNLERIDAVLEAFHDGDSGVMITQEDARKLASHELDVVDFYVAFYERIELAEMFLRAQAAKIEEKARRNKWRLARIKNMFRRFGAQTGRPKLFGKLNQVNLVERRIIKSTALPTMQEFLAHPDLIDSRLSWSVDQPNAEIYSRLLAAGLGDLVQNNYFWRETDVKNKIKAGSEDFKNWFSDEREIAVGFDVRATPKIDQDTIAQLKAAKAAKKGKK